MATSNAGKLACQARYRASHKEQIKADDWHYKAKNKAAIKRANAVYRSKHKKKAKAYQRRHKTKLKHYYRDWKRNRSPEQIQASKEKDRLWRLRKVYGLSLSDFNDLVTKQDNKCAICTRSFDFVRIAIDHDHSTGRVRGLLCSSCNTGLGLFGDDLLGLLKAVWYLEETM